MKMSLWLAVRTTLKSWKEHIESFNVGVRVGDAGGINVWAVSEWGKYTDTGTVLALLTLLSLLCKCERGRWYERMAVPENEVYVDTVLGVLSTTCSWLAYAV